MNGIIAQLTNTKEYDGINIIDCNIVKVNTEINKSFSVSYEKLNSAEKKKVDEFIDLIISLSNKN
jgi:hypothetical protein